MKTVCVFLGENLGATDIYKKNTVLLAQEIAKRKLDIVYGGSTSGLMSNTRSQ